MRRFATSFVDFLTTRLHFLTMGLLCLVALTACTTSEADDGGTAAVDGLSGSLGVIRVDRSADVFTPELVAPGGEVGAAFARYRGVEGSDVLELLGRNRAAQELDSCVLAKIEPVTLSGLSAEVELLDVGAIEVMLAERSVELSARTFPELGGLVSGVFYAEDTALPLSRADIDEYRIEATGGAELPTFEVVAVGPPGVAELLLDGLPAADELTLERGREVAVAWASGDPRDRIEIDLVAGADVVTCYVRDDGFHRVGGDLTARLGADRDARLVVRRTRTQPFDAPGIDVAWLSVATARAFAIHVD